MAPALVLILLLIPWPAWSARPLLVAPSDSLVIEGRTLRGGRRGPVVDCRGVLVLRDCILIGRDGRQPLLTVKGDAARLRLERCLVRGAGRPGRRNSLQESDSESDSRAVASTPGPSLPALITLQGGRLDMVCSTLAAAPGQPFLGLDAAAGARLNSCLLAGGGGPAPVAAGAGSTRVELSWCLTDRLAWAAEFPPFRSAPGNHAVADLRFVAPQRGDFRPCWDSPALDAGDPDFPLDFDLTNADSGWHSPLEVTVLSGGVSSQLRARHFRITEDTVIRGRIPAGAVLRVESGKALVLNPDGDGRLQIGTASGPRTAIVGRPAPLADPARLLLIECPQQQDAGRLSMHGALFHYPPQGASGTSLVFSNWGNEQQPGLDLDTGSIHFQRYQAARGPSGTMYDGGLRVIDSVGRIHGLSLGTADGASPTYLDIYKGMVDVDSCTFNPSNTPSSVDIPCLKVDCASTGAAPTLSRNVFQGNTANQAPLLDIAQGIVNLRGNRFLECRDTPLEMFQCTVHAANEARNDWRASGDFELLEPMVNLQGGFIDMFCGHNNIVVRNYDITWPIVTWTPDINAPTPLSASWRENYWGLIGPCQNPILDEFWNNPAYTLIPSWAAAEDRLSECVDAMTPADPACPYEPDTPAELLKYGIEAELEGNFPLAQEHYRYLLWLHPKSLEANEGTLRLKALGLDKEHGPEAWESVRDDLFAAADSSTMYLQQHQAVLQMCGAWCVEARWGDREAAVDTLEWKLGKEHDKLNRDTIQMALLEIATYPDPGSLSAAGPQAQIARAVARQAAVEELFRFQRGQGSPPVEATALPRRFAIARLYPNPFNARTTLELELPVDGHLRVTIYNLLGQRVDTPFDGPARAGRRQVVVDASRWASGLYMALAEHDGQARARKLMVIK